MLTLVHPSRDGQGGDPSKPRCRRRASICLTPAEADALTAALKNLHQRYTWPQLAELCGVSALTIRCVANGRANGSPGLALRVARVAGLSIARVLTPGPAPIASCPHCGGALEGT